MNEFKRQIDEIENQVNDWRWQATQILIGVLCAATLLYLALKYLA